MKGTVVVVLSTLLIVGATSAGEFNKTLSIGDDAPSWSNLEGTDGKKHSLDDLKEHDVVVVVFTCNSCPVAVIYEDRIIAMAKEHAGEDSSVAVVAINVNTGSDDALPAMKARAEKKKFPFAYLYDPSQEIARQFGANYTPEYFVLDQDRKVVYMGAMEDKIPPGEPTKQYLADAIRAVVAGKQPPISETRAVGCRIKFTRRRSN